MIVLTSIVLIVTNEARQATEADLGNRAYFAAQAGLEEGIFKVKSALADPTNPTAALHSVEDSCQSNSFGSDLDYSCLYLTHSNNTLEGPLYKDSTPVQIDLSAMPAASKIEISWNNSSDGQLTNLASLPGAFATGGNWHSNPAVLEVSTIRFKLDGGGLFDPTDPTQLQIVKNIFVPSAAVPWTLTDYTNPIYRTAPIYSSCSATITPTNPYNCKQTLDFSTDPGPTKHVIVISARFNGTHYSIRVFNNGGVLITSNIPNQYETIDVTAKAGSVFRRVRSKVAIYKGTAALDYAIFSDQDVCKSFVLRDSKSGTSGANIGGCPF